MEIQARLHVLRNRILKFVKCKTSRNMPLKVLINTKIFIRSRCGFVGIVMSCN